MNIDWSKVDFGSLPDWLAAGSATAAFAVAVVAAWATVRTNQAQQTTLELQRRQLADAQEQANRAQASKVALAVDSEPDAYHGRGVVTRIWNSSDTPIYRVALIEIFGSKAEQAQVVNGLEHLSPTGAGSFEYSIEEGILHLAGELVLMFEDANGELWRRDRHGSLEDVRGEMDTAGTEWLRWRFGRAIIEIDE